MLRTVHATRYVTPLREGGSLPAIVEADDLGLYVLKFKGAGQGPLVLVAELLAGEIGRALELPIPELVFVEVNAALGRNEPDSEIRHLLAASCGLNLALDYLPGSTMFNIAARDGIEPELASRIVLFDSFITNVDRTVRNPNLLLWHDRPFLIDHGAAFYFHHNWPEDPQLLRRAASNPFSAVRHHLLLRMASQLAEQGRWLIDQLQTLAVEEIAGQIPEEWLGVPENRDAYRQFLQWRTEQASVFIEEAVRARAELV